MRLKFAFAVLVLSAASLIAAAPVPINFEELHKRTSPLVPLKPFGEGPEALGTLGGNVRTNTPWPQASTSHDLVSTELSLGQPGRAPQHDVSTALSLHPPGVMVEPRRPGSHVPSRLVRSPETSLHLGIGPNVVPPRELVVEPSQQVHWPSHPTPRNSAPPAPAPASASSPVGARVLTDLSTAAGRERQTLQSAQVSASSTKQPADGVPGLLRALGSGSAPPNAGLPEWSLPVVGLTQKRLDIFNKGDPAGLRFLIEQLTARMSRKRKKIEASALRPQTSQDVARRQEEHYDANYAVREGAYMRQKGVSAEAAENHAENVFRKRRAQAEWKPAEHRRTALKRARMENGSTSQVATQADVGAAQATSIRPTSSSIHSQGRPNKRLKELERQP